jgi:serine/threonine protein kinase
MVVSKETIEKDDLFAGRFKILKPLGRGFLGAVYHAYDQETQTEVALKIMQEASSRKNIEQEAHLLVELRSAEEQANAEEPDQQPLNAASPIFSGPTFIYSGQKPIPFLAMELMRGRKISDLLEESPTAALTEPTALSIGFQIFRLLDVLHERLQKSYTDLKFENLWWQPSQEYFPQPGLLKVIDWNVLDELTTQTKTSAVSQDLFRAALYLYRIAVGILPKLHGSSNIHRLDDIPSWEKLSFGFQHILAGLLIERRYSSSRAVKEDFLRILLDWQKAPRQLASEINKHIVTVNEIKKNLSSASHTILYPIREAREKESIAHLLLKQPGALSPNEKSKSQELLDYLKPQLDQLTDIRISIALFKGGSIEKARLLIEEALPYSLDPGPLLFWKELMKAAAPFSHQHHAVAEVGEAFQNKNYSEARHLLKDNHALSEMTDSLKHIGAAISVMSFYSNAEDLWSARKYGEAAGQYKQALQSLEDSAENLFPPYFRQLLSHQIDEAIHLKETVEDVIDKLNQGRKFLENEQYEKAADTWLEGLKKDPGNVELLQSILNAAQELLSKDNDTAVLTLASGLPAVIGENYLLNDLRRQALAKRSQKVAAQLELQIQNDSVKWENARKEAEQQARLDEEIAERARQNSLLAEQKAEEQRRLGEQRGFVHAQKAALGQAAAAQDWTTVLQVLRQVLPYPQFTSEHKEISRRIQNFVKDWASVLPDGGLQDFLELKDSLPSELSESYRGIFHLLASEQKRRVLEASLPLTEKLKEQLQDNSFTTALHTAREILHTPSADQSQNKNLQNLVLSRLDSLVQDPPIWDESLSVFGQLFGPQFESQMTNKGLEAQQRQLKQRFSELQRMLAASPSEEIVQAMKSLVSSYPQLDPGLQEVWFKGWDGLFSALSLSPSFAGCDLLQLEEIIALVWKEQKKRREYLDFFLETRRKKLRAQVLRHLELELYPQALQIIQQEHSAGRGDELIAGVVEAELEKAAARMAKQADLLHLKALAAALQGFPGKQEWGKEHLQQAYSMVLKKNFAEMHKLLCSDGREQALSQIRRLLDEYSRVPKEVQPVYRDDWEKIVIQALSLPWEKDQEKLKRDIYFVIQAVWPQQSERQDVLSKVDQEREEALKNWKTQQMQELKSRIYSVEFEVGNELARLKHQKELTVAAYRSLISQFDQILSLLPREDATARSVREKYKPLKAVLGEADELWKKAEKEEDEAAQRQYVLELRRRGFAGWQMPGDFEKLLNLKPLQQEPKTVPASAKQPPAAASSQASTLPASEADRPAALAAAEPLNGYRAAQLFELYKQDPDNPELKQAYQEYKAQFQNQQPTQKEKGWLVSFQKNALIDPRDALAEMNLEYYVNYLSHPDILTQFVELRQKVTQQLENSPQKGMFDT